MKLGIYVINCGDLPLDWFAKAQPTLVVSMDANPDYWREVKRVSPRTFILGRYYVDSQPFDSPIQNAIDFCTLMRPSALLMKGIYDAWMSYNEPAVWNQTDAENLSRFTSVWSDKMHFDGIETAAYSFSEGHPDLSLWPYLTEGIRRSNYLCLHEYDWPTMYRTQGWRCLRYRKVLKALPEDMQNTPIIIGETGIDGGVTNEQTSQPFAPVTGWNGTGDVQHYIESLSWYNSEISRDQQVVGAALFAAHWNQGNGSFDIANEIAIRDFIGKEEMDQALFDKLTAGSGAVYVPSSQSPKYELVAIAVAWGPTNNRIRVSVKNEDGSDAFNVWVRHSFGGDKERFPYVGNPVEFNLGVGSHYSQPDPPPDRITVEGLASDEVDV